MKIETKALGIEGKALGIAEHQIGSFMTVQVDKSATVDSNAKIGQLDGLAWIMRPFYQRLQGALIELAQNGMK